MPYYQRIVLFILISVVAISAVSFIFWKQELQYILPTPVPANYKVVLPGEVLAFNQKILLPKHRAKPVLLHFFNPTCPCSRFNIKHFRELYLKYGNKVQCYVVVPETRDLALAKEYFPEQITVIHDQGDQLAKACGVYSTPQAVLINTNNQLYFRGNYNRSRYCTDKQTNYTQQALESLIAQQPLPVFDTLAVVSYGCTLNDAN